MPRKDGLKVTVRDAATPTVIKPKPNKSSKKISDEGGSHADPE